jgi:lipopolysaccharide transport system ATP-binding protein
MIKNPAISVRGLAKAYTISHMTERHTTMVEALAHQARSLFRPRPETETFWALRDISFDLQAGEVVGIIGRNGAGKSTLLKVLSQITEPTDGEIDLYGRVGSLLEVGTGFHPELTGRENIFLNGAILGMSRCEIRSQFEAIVEFSGVEQFLDTPVKRYSSGMYVRLAFAVAAHLNPEILIVDEVLAVGDAEFQKKCLGKMQDVAHSGRTVIFVSHNMQAVSQLCEKGLLLEQGKMVFNGDVNEAIERYVSSWAVDRGPQERNLRRPGSGEVRFTSVKVAKDYFHGDEKKEIAFRIARQRPGGDPVYLSAHIVDQQGVIVAQADSRLVGQWLGRGEEFEGAFEFSSPWLKPGAYRLDLFICSAGAGVVDHWDGAAMLQISPLLPYPNHVSGDGTAHGLVFANFEWRCRTVDSSVAPDANLAVVS